MDENVSALYSLLLDKTRGGSLAWAATDGGTAFIAPVGNQTVKIGGIRAKAKQSSSGNAFAGLPKDWDRQPTIVVYDSKLNVVASGGVDGQPIQNALAAISPFGIENISSPRLLELADLLATKYGKPSSVQQLVETLKAS
ncbi:hypothetical protein [Aquidulcibacter paucihalophilus]|uniref:hypothetical protein n=1 Tax=Aquidulcibacter paucihalophilus TaxID=1978549 RepID=UPI000A198A59|nr:hypothetical protein [Aquidulcibacter paucihalophilus]